MWGVMAHWQVQYLAFRKITGSNPTLAATKGLGQVLHSQLPSAAESALLCVNFNTVSMLWSGAPLSSSGIEEVLYKFIHSFIHYKHLYSASSSGATQRRSQPQHDQIKPP